MNKAYKPFYRTSDLTINRYFAQPQFRNQIKEASKHGKEVFYNELRKLNNCYYARKLNGDITIKDIFINYWSSFKETYNSQLTRLGLIESIDAFGYNPTLCKCGTLMYLNYDLSMFKNGDSPPLLYSCIRL